MTKKRHSFSYELFKDKCKEHNLKITPQRISVYEELFSSPDHPNADVIFRKVRKTFPNISFDTINRTLLTFAKIGIVRIVEGSGEPKRFDSDIDNHHHFRCMKCNRIIDFQNKFYDNIKIPEDFKKQFTVLNKRVVLEGFCNKCKKTF